MHKQVFFFQQQTATVPYRQHCMCIIINFKYFYAHVMFYAYSNFLTSYAFTLKTKGIEGNEISKSDTQWPFFKTHHSCADTSKDTDCILSYRYLIFLKDRKPVREPLHPMHSYTMQPIFNRAFYNLIYNYSNLWIYIKTGGVQPRILFQATSDTRN